MEKIVISLGTTSKWKIQFVEKVLNEIGLDFEIVPVKTSSGVSNQPISEDETLKGSVNRARQALHELPRAELGLGIEVGYHKDSRGDYEMFCYATIAEREGNLISCCSHRFLLPKIYQDVLKENKEMCDHVERYYQKDDHPATQYLAKMIDQREPFIVEAVRSAILRYLRRGDY